MNRKHWKKTNRTFLLCLLLVILLFAGGHRPVQAGSKLPLRVPADIEWVSTGIWLYSEWVGYPVNIKTTGTVITMQGNQSSQSGPEGQPDAICQDTMLGEIVLTCALADAPFGHLIGRVGDVVFPISDATSFDIQTTGFLYLTVNEYLGTFYDNTGGFTVLIEFK